METIAQHLPQSLIGKACAYLLGAWTQFTRFLDDMRIPLSNNDVERALRHAVIGRNNYHGSKSINGADLAATLFTVIESCKRVQLDPAKYLDMAVRGTVRGESLPTPLQWALSLVQPNASIPA